MSISGTAAYDDTTRISSALPPPVREAVALAVESGFEFSCLPEHGELLRLLARGVPDGGVIGETGTGCGVGLAWLAAGARPGTRVVIIERDAERAARAARLFDDRGEVDVLTGDWPQLREHGPFDMLVLDGGGQGKAAGAGASADAGGAGGIGAVTLEQCVDPEQWLRPGGLIVMDDFSPLTQWPPLFQGEVDAVRVHWLDHPRLRATQVNVAPGASTLIATFVG